MTSFTVSSYEMKSKPSVGLPSFSAMSISQNCQKTYKNQENDAKFHKSHQILNQYKRNITKLCFGKISGQKTVKIKLSVDSGLSNMYCKFQILLETNFLTEILKIRHLLLIMRKKPRTHPKYFLFWENHVSLRIYLIELYVEYVSKILF